MEGSGRMVVCAVGIHSQIGIIMTLLGVTKGGGGGFAGNSSAQNTVSSVKNAAVQRKNIFK